MKSSRKFRPINSFQKSTINYYLLPFRFHTLNHSTEVLVNEVGDYLICKTGTARKIANREIHSNDAIYPDLVSNFFISEKPIPDLIDVLATKYRTKKSFLDNFTCLHIFVVTLRCNHTCQYCQVSRQSENRLEYDMSYEDLDKSIELMFNSPSNDLTVEFQGGEPLIAFEKVRHAVCHVKKVNVLHKRNITFVLCTNLSCIDDKIIDFCKNNQILISTSYDGPAYVHNSNRTISRGDSHELVLRGIAKCREALGLDMVSALMTTSNLTLKYPVEIIDDYVNQGFSSIFLRPINPFGFARKNPAKNMYETNKFLEFYKTALRHIIDLNLRGRYFVEEYANVILSKILTPFPDGFTDLQSPSGVINNVIVYNYDGYVYASDESRMLAEEGDYTFRLGHVQRNSYQEIFYGEKAQQISEYWANESLPGCSECGFQAYCGADPVRNYSTQGHMVGYRPTNTFCKKNMEITRFLFELMSEDPDIERIFRSWVNKTEL